MFVPGRGGLAARAGHGVEHALDGGREVVDGLRADGAWAEVVSPAAPVLKQVPGVSLGFAVAGGVADVEGGSSVGSAVAKQGATLAAGVGTSWLVTAAGTAAAGAIGVGAVAALPVTIVAVGVGALVAYGVGANWDSIESTAEDLLPCGLPLLEFRDGSGRRVRRYVSELRADPLMWDLVHLGVRWSRAIREVRVNRAAEAVVGGDPLPSRALARRSRVTVARVRRDDPRTAELPPRPDPRTCRPIPPPAPWTDADATVQMPRRPQSLPPGRGPLVGGRSGVDVRGLAAFGIGLVVVAVLVVALVGVDLLAAHPLVTAVYGTGTAVVIGAIAWVATARYVAAGADWAADELAWVDLYDLVAVHVARTRWGVPALALTDGEGRRRRGRSEDPAPDEVGR